MCAPTCVAVATLASLTPDLTATVSPQCIIAGPITTPGAAVTYVRLPARVVVQVSAATTLSVVVNGGKTPVLLGNGVGTCCTGGARAVFPVPPVTAETTTVVVIDVEACGGACTDCCKAITGIGSSVADALDVAYVTQLGADAFSQVALLAPYILSTGPAAPSYGIQPPVLPLLRPRTLTLAPVMIGPTIQPVAFQFDPVEGPAASPTEVIVTGTYVNLYELEAQQLYKAVWADSPVSSYFGVPAINLRAVTDADVTPGTGCTLNTLVAVIDSTPGLTLQAYVVRPTTGPVQPFGLQPYMLVFADPAVLVSSLELDPSGLQPFTFTLQ
jgi:hypothetical protein